jgi:hypothetical protein
MNASEEQAKAMGLQPLRHRIAGPDPELEGTFAMIKTEHADALLVLEEPVRGVHAAEIATLATKRQPTNDVPAIQGRSRRAHFVWNNPGRGNPPNGGVCGQSA